jgi:hypothetical protein
VITAGSPVAGCARIIRSMMGIMHIKKNVVPIAYAIHNQCSSLVA